MGTTTSSRKSLLLRLLAAAIAAALLSTLIPGLASPYNQERMDKDIAIMENVINTSMVESEHVYIFATHQNVRGLHIPEFGAVFTVQVQLLSSRAMPWVFGLSEANPWAWSMYWDKDKWEGFIEGLEDLEIEVNGEKIDLKDYIKEAKKHGDRDKTVVIKPEKNEEMVKKNLEKFKHELVGIVADYGGTIRQLDDDKWIMVVAYIGDSHSIVPVNKVIVKAKKSDVDLYDYGKIDFEELESRMVVEEQ
jgi:hypothetical protein